MALILTLSAPGCSTHPVAKAIGRVDLSQGDRPQIHPSRKHLQDTQILITFSGGGTRAAAFASGVLGELRHTPVLLAREPVDSARFSDALQGAMAG